MKTVGDAKMATQPAQQRVLFEVWLLVGEDQHLDAGDDEESAKDIEQPGKLLHQPDTGENHTGAHDDGAEHAIEQDAALQLWRHGEIAEDHHENEHVVDRQRLLDQVARQEFERCTLGHFGAEHAAQIPPEQDGEDQRQTGPGDDPGQRFAY
ncbi:hypothetical protein D9M72_551350 [compost metagenome]